MPKNFKILILLIVSNSPFVTQDVSCDWVPYLSVLLKEPTSNASQLFMFLAYLLDKRVLNIQDNKFVPTNAKEVSCYSFVLGFPLGARSWLVRTHVSSQSSPTEPGKLGKLPSLLVLDCSGVCPATKETVSQNEVNVVWPWLRSLSRFRLANWKEEPTHSTVPAFGLTALSQE